MGLLLDYGADLLLSFYPERTITSVFEIGIMFEPIVGVICFHNSSSLLIISGHSEVDVG